VQKLDKHVSMHTGSIKKSMKIFLKNI